MAKGISKQVAWKIIFAYVRDDLDKQDWDLMRFCKDMIDLVFWMNCMHTTSINRT